MRLALLLAALATPGLAADPATGLWQSPPDRQGQVGHIRIAPCGAALCGTLEGAFAGGKPIASDMAGKRILWDMAPQGGGHYEGGRIYAPDYGRDFAAKMDLSGDRLAVAGCLLGVCRGQTWSRIGR